MDELAAALAGSFEISNDLNKTSAPHPRFTQYKSKSTNSDQDGRRKRLLEIQKQNRFDFLNHVRKLTEDDWKDADDEEDEDKEGDGMEVEFKKPGRYYKDQLMMSEWLVEVPPDLAEEWVMVLSPVGRRTLVVTNGYSTKAFSRGGHFLRSFPSLLPGGARKNRKGQRHSTILDTIYNEETKTFYVLDLMCWKGHSIYNTESEFRFYWLHDKFKETPGLEEVSKINPLKFIPLPNFPCTPESISQAIASANFEIDGLLFYHKRTHYLFGSSPLVVWLKPYMVPEILGIPIPEQQMSHQPAEYTNYADHIRQVGEDKTKDTNITKRDYKQHGISKPQRKKHGDQEMTDDPGAGGEGQGHTEGMEGEVSAAADGDGDATAASSAHGGGGGDMESESLHK